MIKSQIALCVIVIRFLRVVPCGTIYKKKEKKKQYTQQMFDTF